MDPKKKLRFDNIPETKDIKFSQEGISTFTKEAKKGTPKDKIEVSFNDDESMYNAEGV